MKLNYFLAVSSLFLISLSISGQASILGNIGQSNDYLGWSAGVNQELRIGIQNPAFIRMRVAQSNHEVLIRPNSLSLGVNGGGLLGVEHLRVSLNSFNSPGPIGIQAQVISPFTGSTITTYGGYFSLRTDGQRDQAVNALADGFQTTPENYGIFAEACFPKSIAVVGRVPTSGSGANTWAGYFEGDVWHSGSWPAPSDINLKQNISDYTGSLEVLNSLQVKSYDFNEEAINNHGFVEGRQVGFISQEIEEILPNLVKQASTPAKYDDEDQLVLESRDILTMNYLGLIPVIMDGLSERQDLIDQQLTQIEQLEALIIELESQIDTDGE